MQVRRVIGYVRVAPREQRSTRPGLGEQRRAVEAECRSRGWDLIRFEQDVRSGRSLRRPGLLAALDACRGDEADGIVVARIDRLTYSVEDLAYVMHRAVEDEFTIVAPDIGVDLGTDAGAHLARVLSVAAQWQSRSVGRRARLALEHQESRGSRPRAPLLNAARARRPHPRASGRADPPSRPSATRSTPRASRRLAAALTGDRRPSGRSSSHAQFRNSVPKRIW